MSVRRRAEAGRIIRRVLCLLGFSAFAAANAQTGATPELEAAGYFRTAARAIDSGRPEHIEDGTGLSVAYGRRWIERWSWEIAYSAANLETGWGAGTDFYQNTLGVSFVRTFGAERGVTPFLSAGAGLIEDDAWPDEADKTDPYIDVGFGLLFKPIGRSVARLRGELRAIHDFQDESMTHGVLELGVLVPIGRQAVRERVVERVVYREIEVAAQPPPVRVPLPDSDDDGVVDRLDQCPNTLPGAAVEPDGCVRAAQRVELPGVNFEFGSARLTESAERILERAYLALRDQPEIVVEIAGHTDSIGSDSANLTLSQGRADSVRNFLVSRGISPSRLTARGYGEEQPIASEVTDADRARNRRVELRIQE